MPRAGALSHRHYGAEISRALACTLSARLRLNAASRPPRYGAVRIPKLGRRIRRVPQFVITAIYCALQTAISSVLYVLGTLYGSDEEIRRKGRCGGTYNRWALSLSLLSFTCASDAAEKWDLVLCACFV